MPLLGSVGNARRTSSRAQCELSGGAVEATPGTAWWPAAAAAAEGAVQVCKTASGSDATSGSLPTSSSLLDLLATVRRALSAADSLAALSRVSSRGSEEFRWDATLPTSNSGGECVSASAAYLQTILAAVATLAESQHIDLENAVRCRIRSLALQEHSLLGFPAAAHGCAPADGVDAAAGHDMGHEKHARPGVVEEGQQPALDAQETDREPFRVLSAEALAADMAPRSRVADGGAESHSCSDMDLFSAAAAMAAVLGVDVAGGPEDVQCAAPVEAAASNAPAPPPPCVAAVAHGQAPRRAPAEGQAHHRPAEQHPRPMPATATATAGDVDAGAPPIQCTAAACASQPSPPEARDGNVAEAERVPTRRSEFSPPTRPPQAATSRCASHAVGISSNQLAAVVAGEGGDECVATFSVADGRSSGSAGAAGAPLARELATAAGADGGGVAPIPTAADRLAASAALLGLAAHNTAARRQVADSAGGPLVPLPSPQPPRPHSAPPLLRGALHPILFPTAGRTASPQLRLENDMGASSLPENVAAAPGACGLRPSAELSAGAPRGSRPCLPRREATSSSWTPPVSVSGDAAEEQRARRQEEDAAACSQTDNRAAVGLPVGGGGLLPLTSSTPPLAPEGTLRQEQQQQCEVSAMSAVTVSVSPFLPCDEFTPSSRWSDEVSAAPMTTPTPTPTPTPPAANATLSVLRATVPSTLPAAAEQMDEGAKPEVAVPRGTAAAAPPVEDDCPRATSQEADTVGSWTAMTPTPSVPPQGGSRATTNIATVASESGRSSTSVAATPDENAGNTQSLPPPEARGSAPPHQALLRGDGERRASPGGRRFPYGLLLLQQLLQEQ
ncbi:uncharacterized protein Tco025E_07736 [Trypanosoma conorhini]|uniref:Uncharacterized protein n=1 Tax=Trypanosoma conorhini TaxID=83891 RepID=A0A3R7RK04_9TRYP|nr:uncharacterized protein Tco025E_07736 [Trypanosoma conorhini]RNF05737.1 hypothetical protein Tco025E_07736 [Trypanosoma conorhini]